MVRKPVLRGFRRRIPLTSRTSIEVSKQPLRRERLTRHAAEGASRIPSPIGKVGCRGRPSRRARVTDVLHRRTRATRPSWKNERTTRRRTKNKMKALAPPLRYWARPPAPFCIFIPRLRSPPRRLTHSPPRPSGPQTATTPRCAPSTYIPPRRQSRSFSPSSASSSTKRDSGVSASFSPSRHG